MTKEDFMNYKYILCMDESNLRYSISAHSSSVCFPCDCGSQLDRQSLKTRVSCVKCPVLLVNGCLGLKKHKHTHTPSKGVKADFPADGFDSDVCYSFTYT